MTTVLFFRSDHSDFVDYRMLSLLPALLPASLRWAAHPPSLLCLLSPSLSEIVLGKSHHRSQHSPFVRLLKSIMKSGRCFWSHTTPSPLGSLRRARSAVGGSGASRNRRMNLAPHAAMASKDYIRWL